MARSQSISIIRRRHPEEWLLIRVDKMDKATTTPLTGRLIAHSPDRDVILHKSIGAKGLTYIDSTCTLPEGCVIVF